MAQPPFPRCRHTRLTVFCGGLLCLLMTLATPSALAQSTASARAMPVFLGAFPLHGLSPEHMLTALRRQQLPPAARLECAALDTRIPALLRALHRAAPADKATARAAYQDAQARFQQLRC